MAKKIYPCDGASAKDIACNIVFSDGQVADNYQDALDIMAEKVAECPTSGGHYEESFAEPSAEWTVRHGLGGEPNVLVENNDGENVNGTVRYIDGNTLSVKFDTPTAGTIYVY